mgnify:CR=1 FL=1
MNINSIHIDEISNDLKNAKIIKKKRERAVYQADDLYIKIWVPNWTQGDITKYCVDSGYYDEENASSLISLIYDKSGQRGYVTKAGKSVGSSWSQFVEATGAEDRKVFMKSILKNSFKSRGIYTDLFPTNFVMCKRLSLIDFDSFNSFSFIFNEERQPYEKFELDVWWKPHETAVRDTNKYYSEYFEKCLGTKLDFKIDSVENIGKMMSLLS